MNSNEFEIARKGLGSHDWMSAECDGCHKVFPRQVTRIQQNINKNGCYLCRSCSIRKHHAEHPPTEETRRKQSESRKGWCPSIETREKMSISAKRKWDSPEGELLKSNLVKKAMAQQHAFDKSKRKVHYISVKNDGEIRACLSSYEFVALDRILEKDPLVMRYETQVPYHVNGRHHSLDILVEYYDGSKKVIEVKPKKLLTSDRNIEQMFDSEEYARQHGYGFAVWTEDELRIINSRDATKLADEYRKEHYMSDFSEYRKQRGRKRAKKHYDDVIAKEKTTVFCQYCQKDHTILTVSYQKNIEKNGKYICHQENSVKTGKMDKTGLGNPYYAEGKKECNCCHEILPFNCFSSNGPGKLASKCKKCRAAIYQARYQEKKPK